MIGVNHIEKILKNYKTGKWSVVSKDRMPDEYCEELEINILSIKLNVFSVIRVGLEMVWINPKVCIVSMKLETVASESIFNKSKLKSPQIKVKQFVPITDNLEITQK